MKDILDYRLVVIDKDGSITKFSWEIGKGHQACLDDFAKENGYDYSSYDFLLAQGVCLFYNCGLNMVIVRLPFELNDHQLYSLDYIENFLDNVTYMEVAKGLGKEQQEFVFFENIKERFSGDVIQSFYDKSKSRK